MIQITKSAQFRNRIVSLLYIVFLSSAYMSIPNDFLENSISLSQTLELSADELQLSFEEDRFLSEIFDIREVDALNELNTACDSSMKELKIIESEFVENVGGLDEYGMVVKKTNTVKVVNYFIDLKKWENIKNILDTLSLKVTDAIDNDSLASVVESVLFPERPILAAKKGPNKENWGLFYFKNTPAMQAHVHLQNIMTKVILVKSMATRFLVDDKLRDIQIQNFVEVNELPDTLAELAMIRVRFMPDFNTKQVVEVPIPFNTKRLMAEKKMMLSAETNASATLLSFRDYEISIDLSDYVNQLSLPEFEEIPEDLVPKKEMDYVLKPKNPILYVDVPNKINLKGAFDSENSFVTASYGEVSKIKEDAFYFECNSAGYVHFQITDNVQNTFIGTFSFPVQELPKPKPILSQNVGGDISVLTVRRLEALDLYFEDIDWLNALDFYSVKGFDLIHITDGGATTAENRSSAFNDDVARMIDVAKSGDRLIFKNIKVMRQGEVYKLDPLVLEVI